MNSEKLENQLNMSLDLPKEEREKSASLDLGFDAKENTWELIIQYTGVLSSLEKKFPEASFTKLLGGYVIVIIPENQIRLLAMQPQVEFIEKPKALYFEIQTGKQSSCINQVQQEGQGLGSAKNLSGKDVLVAVIDSGIDYSHPDFRNANGSSRILWLWDQTLTPRTEYMEGPPEGFYNGVEFSREQIDEALEFDIPSQQYQVCPSRDISGHGTHVAGIAAGNGRASAGRYRGVAYESELIIVKLGSQQERGFPKTTQLMEAVSYVIKKAQAANKPVAINISFGNNYGSHTGTSLIENYLNTVSQAWKSNIVVGTGNDGASRIHTAGTMQEGKTEVISYIIGSFQTGFNIQLWKRYEDEIEINLITPGNQRLGPLVEENNTFKYEWEGNHIYVYYGSPVPYSIFQEIYFEYIPKEIYLDVGEWKIELIPKRIVTGSYELWMPAGGVLNENTGFLFPVAKTTLTIPSTAVKVISVGAYDSYRSEYASFSGRGYTWSTNYVKPDIAAPGVNIISCAPGGGYASKTGTSMATPFVTGSCALLMQWGIIDENDPYLYGEKIKAYIIKGAKKLPGYQEYPNAEIGWGVLCLYDAIIR